MNWDDLINGRSGMFFNPEDLIGQTFTFNTGTGTTFNFGGRPDGYYSRPRFEPKTVPPEGYRDEMGCRTWLGGRWVDDEEVARKEWTPSLIYSYDLVIPEDAIEAGVEDGAFVITHLDKVVGSDIALLHGH